MQFRTEIQIPETAAKLSLGHRIITIGSCFADVIGNKLQQHKLSALVNPFGTIFNPISQLELLEAALAPEEQEELPMVQQNGRWYAYNFHSSFSDTTRQGLREQVDFQLSLVREELQKANLLVLTFGTAIVYQLADNDRIVANCHKIPQDQFNKRLLLAEEIVSYFTHILALLKDTNPGIKVVLTVSPVRHLKDTLVLNSVSKSVLRTACHYISDLLPDVDYFPAFELLMDDLRDYRFYKDDLLHPSQMAEDYVWQKFTGAYFGSELQKFAQEWASVRQSLAHRPFQQDSPGHQEFLLRLQDRLTQLSAQADVSAELAQVRAQMMPVRKNQVQKKAPRELVSLLEVLAASDVMSEENEMRHSQPDSSTEFKWPGQEDDDQEEIEEAIYPPATKGEAEEPPTDSQSENVPQSKAVPAEQNIPPAALKKSKAKKRREKRKAKLLASRENTTARLQANREATEAPPIKTAAAPELASQPDDSVPLSKQQKGKGKDRPVKKRNQNKSATSRHTPEIQAQPPLEVHVISDGPAEAQPESVKPVKPEPKKRATRKPAANVAALMNALAQAQAQTPATEAKKPKEPKAGKAAASDPNPTEPHAAKRKAPRQKSQPAQPGIKSAREQMPPGPTTPAQSKPAGQKPEPAQEIIKPKRGRKPGRRAAADAPEIPFGTFNPQGAEAGPGNIQAQTSSSSQPDRVNENPDQPVNTSAQKSSKETKPKAPKKENGGANRGKAKKIVLKKSPANKTEK